MSTEIITIQVDADAARSFAASTPEVRQKLEVLLSLRLRELVHGNPRSLTEVMDEIGAKAEAQGLTAAELESMFRDE